MEPTVGNLLKTTAKAASNAVKAQQASKATAAAIAAQRPSAARTAPAQGQGGKDGNQ